MKLEGHHGEVWALAVAKHGTFVVTGSHDRSIRIWERTEDQVRTTVPLDVSVDCITYPFL